jgi:hypothetical protein
MTEAEWQTGLAWKRLSEKRPLILRFAEAMRTAVREPGAGGASRKNKTIILSGKTQYALRWSQQEACCIIEINSSPKDLKSS